MLVYHGSNLTVEKPRIIVSDRFLDFGPGFYTTTNLAQAKSFASRVTDRRKTGQNCVSVYELDDAVLKKLKVLSFDSADERWLNFVSANRIGETIQSVSDLIIGPVANDDVYQTFLLYTTGVLNKEQTLEALKVKKLFNQYVFATDRALECLKFLRVLQN